MAYNYEITRDRLVYKMPTEVDHHIAKSIGSEIDSLIEQGMVRHVLFDMERTNFMDSSGIGLVIGRSRKLKFFGGDVSVANMSDRVDLILRSCGVYKVVGREEI